MNGNTSAGTARAGRRTRPLAAGHAYGSQADEGVLGIGLAPDFAIITDPAPYHAGTFSGVRESVTEEAVAALKTRGGVDRIVISHCTSTLDVGVERCAGRIPILLTR